MVNFYASSQDCVILSIDIADIESLAKENIVLNDRLSVIKIRIKNKAVDDIDYFTYPKRFLESNVENQTELSRQLKIARYVKAKNTMILEILSYVRQYKAGKCQYP